MLERLSGAIGLQPTFGGTTMQRSARLVSFLFLLAFAAKASAGEAAAPSEPKAAPAAKAAPAPAPATPAAPAPPREAFPYNGEVTGTRVYVRAGDGINYTILTVAGPHDRVRVKTRRFDWLGIDVPRTCTVWVHKGMLSAQPDGKTATVTRDRVNVRARALATSNVMGQLPEGATVAIVDTDGEWVGIEPPPQATAWVHHKYVRKTSGAALPRVATPARPVPKDALSMGRSLALLRDARMIYEAELKRPAAQRDFTTVLAAYQKVAEKSANEGLARRAESARQRLLKIVDLHKVLQAARKPIREFDDKYKKLEAEYKRKAGLPNE